MESVLSRLRGLSEDELRQELVRADLKFGPITATTRAIFERKLASVLAGPESNFTETDIPSGVGVSGSAGSGAGRSKPVIRAVAAAAVACGATSASVEAAREEADFGYGSGLNPPEEEVPVPSRTGSSSSEDGPVQPRTETHSKPAQESPTLFYGVCPLWRMFWRGTVSRDSRHTSLAATASHHPILIVHLV